MSYSYPEYDKVGNILTKATEHGSYGYDYDDLYRLTNITNPTPSTGSGQALDDEAYSYDPVGNRLTASGVTGTIDHNQNNELRIYGDISFDYDANGNMVSKTSASESWEYTYNVQNRLVRVEEDDLLVAEYGYDPFGRRLWKEVDGTRTYFLYADEGLVAEYDEDGTELRSYGWQPDSTWGSDPLWLKENREYYWYQNDHLGTPQKLVDSSGTVVWSATYSAFGEAQVDVETVTNNLRFPGQYYDAETGLHQNYHRYYDPIVGRYTKIDPIGFDGGDTNLYGYVGNNPVNLTDPYGEMAVEAVMGWIGGDLSVPEPSDAVWAKWAGYGIILAGAVAVDAILDDEDEKANSREACDVRNPMPTCADMYPQYWQCAALQLSFPGYNYPSAQAALGVLKAQTGVKNLRITSRRPATKGPCAGSGWHCAAKSSGKRPYRASLAGCPCCQDTPAGPVLKELWRILRKY